MNKYPWLAAIFNFIIPGLGYLYAGVRVKFGVLLISAMALMVFGPTPRYAQEQQVNVVEHLDDPAITVMLLAALMIAGAFAYDAYCDTKRLNSKRPKRTKGTLVS